MSVWSLMKTMMLDARAGEVESAGQRSLSGARRVPSFLRVTHSPTIVRRFGDRVGVGEGEKREEGAGTHGTTVMPSLLSSAGPCARNTTLAGSRARPISSWASLLWRGGRAREEGSDGQGPGEGRGESEGSRTHSRVFVRNIGRVDLPAGEGRVTWVAAQTLAPPGQGRAGGGRGDRKARKGVSRRSADQLGAAPLSRVGSPAQASPPRSPPETPNRRVNAPREQDVERVLPAKEQRNEDGGLWVRSLAAVVDRGRAS